MSYQDPTNRDLKRLIGFHRALDRKQNRKNEMNTTLDILRVDFDQYLNPENHADTYSPPYPQIPRSKFTDLSKETRVKKIKSTSLESIQERMESAVILSFIHDVELANIEGIDQSQETVRKQVQSKRQNNQNKLLDYA